MLEDFSLHIRAGETVALVGHTGAGKSTLGKLVARFYEFQGGHIYHRRPRHPLARPARLPPPAWHRPPGAVPVRRHRGRQHPLPPPGSERGGGRRAARHIGGGDWLAALPDGLATEVGEHGQALSMGQRQLVALARLLLQDPAIIILDEATASVDPLTEAQIQEGLDVVLAGRTSIVIAHRLSTIQHADRIIVLRDGGIVEEGDHAVADAPAAGTTPSSTTPTSATSRPTTAREPASSPSAPDRGPPGQEERGAGSAAPHGETSSATSPSPRRAQWSGIRSRSHACRSGGHRVRAATTRVQAVP